MRGGSGVRGGGGIISTGCGFSGATKSGNLLLNLADIGSDGAIASGDFGVPDAIKSSNVGGDCCADGKGTFASFWGGFAEKLLRVKPTATIRIAAMAAFKIGSDSFWFAEGGSRSRTSRTILCQSTPTFFKKLPSVGFDTR